MEVMSRYQVLPNDGPLPWFSGCPIQLHTVQLVRDQLSARVLLRLLALNVTDQPVKSVCLRISCRDTTGTLLQALPDTLLKNIYAAPHSTFQNRQPLYLPAATSSVEVTPERVFFQDGQVWERPTYLCGQLLPPPSPIDAGAPGMAALRHEAQQAGFSCDYYYEEHNDFWYCSCGQPNPIAAQSCGRCCAPRSWLQANMRPAPQQQRRTAPRPDLQEYFGRTPGQYQPVLPTAPPAPAAPPASPAPEQLICDPHTGELIPLEEYNHLMRAMYYQKQEEPPAPPAQTAPPRRTHTALLVTLLLLALAAAAVFLLYPKTQYGRYQKAVSQMNAGQYEAAYAAFLTLGDYREAADNASFCRYYQAQALYEAGNWNEAGTIYASLGDYKKSISLAADCQYRQALAAMEDAAYESAIDFLTQALSFEEENDLYEQKLLQCYYALGRAAEDDGDDGAAIRWYTQCSDYEDAAQRLRACEHRLDEEEDETTGSTQAGGQSSTADSASYAEMYAYVTTHRQRDDETTADYLTQLCQANYRDSQEIYDSLYAWKVEVFFNTDAADLTTHLDTVSASQTLYVHYIVSGGPPDETLALKYTYKKPNGATGEKILSGACTDGSTGNIFWRDGIYAANEQQQSGTMQVSYYDTRTERLLCSGSITITLDSTSS